MTINELNFLVQRLIDRTALGVFQGAGCKEITLKRRATHKVRLCI